MDTLLSQMASWLERAIVYADDIMHIPSGMGINTITFIKLETLNKVSICGDKPGCGIQAQLDRHAKLQP